MDRSILDTDILSEISKGVDINVRQKAIAYVTAHGLLSFTSISVYEVLYGLHAKSARVQATRFTSLISSHDEVVPGKDDYRLAAEIRASLHLAGIEIGAADPVIAACAIRRGLPLVTGNTKHYTFIINTGYPTLQLENWRKP